MLRIRSLCLTQLKRKGVFRPVGSFNEQYQDELTADDRHRQLAMPIDEEEKELNPDEQDENYGRTHFQLLSHTKLYQSMVTGKQLKWIGIYTFINLQIYRRNYVPLFQLTTCVGLDELAK